MTVTIEEAVIPVAATRTVELPKMLIVDDEEGPRESLNFLFEDDYAVTLASSMEEGLTALERENYDIALLDVRMDGMSGLEGLERIRQTNSTIGIIVITGIATLATAQQALRLQADDFVTKPYDAEQLMETVSKVLAKARGKSSLEGHLKDLRTTNERLALVGDVSPTIVHDLANAMTLLIVSSGELVRTAKVIAAGGTSPDFEKTADMIEESAAICLALVKQWQNLLRSTPDQKTPCDIAPMLPTCAKVAGQDVDGRWFKVAVDVPKGEKLTVKGSSISLIRVLTNLMKNACQAVDPESGIVETSARRDGDSISITIHDNGKGIAPENLERIFERGFSTKSEQTNSGLGLFICRETIEEHGGTLTVTSEPGNTLFTVRLPAL